MVADGNLSGQDTNWREARGLRFPRIRSVTPLFACFPVCWFFAALALLFVLVMLAGAYKHDEASTEPIQSSEPQERSWWLLIAIVITIVIPTGMLLMIWLAPDW